MCIINVLFKSTKGAKKKSIFVRLCGLILTHIYQLRLMDDFLSISIHTHFEMFKLNKILYHHRTGHRVETTFYKPYNMFSTPTVQFEAFTGLIMSDLHHHSHD